MRNNHIKAPIRGFSLLELITVVFVISLLAGIGRPYLLQSTIAANEKVAITTLRVLLTGQIQYNSRLQNYASLDQLVSTGMIDESLQDGSKSGYEFSTQNISDIHFEAIAIPMSIGRTGDKGFFVDETAVIRYTPDGVPPDGTSPPVQ